jgi:hypothetical protein
MSIIGSDPLAFLTAQGGVVGTPLTEGGASGADNLDQKQRSAVVGEPIPIVFCRRVSGTGGVLISPPATEAAFSNNTNNDVTASYLLVLSEGQIEPIQVRDVFQRSCRVGSFTQTYNRRAGTFVPGNTLTDITVALVQFSFNSFGSAEPWTWYDATLVNGFWKNILGGVTYNFGTGTYPASVNSVKQVRNTGGGTTAKPEAPGYCGTGGTYEGLSTMAFTITIPSGFDQWNRQVHAFIRGGIYVPRLLDSVTGPSNNVADLLLYLLRNSSRVPESMIDTATSFLAAATFTNANGFWFNGVVSESTNLRDWIGSNLQYFLLRQARIGGKEALKPLVPINANGTIKTTAVAWVFTFTEQHIIPGSFEITYTPLADRKPFCATVLWRQQDDLGIPVMRTAEVRYTGTAVDGPYEQHDLSGFCSSESHAVKVGAYIISKRKHVTHRLQLGVKPDAFNPSLAAGDLVRVRLDRIASTGADSVHDYLYEVDRIGKSITGEVQLDLTHFPVDANLASVVAQEVNSATGTGLLLPTGLSGITCDINSSGDTSVPAETFTSGSFPDYGSSFGSINESGLGGGGGNSSNSLDNQEDVAELGVGLQPEGALPGLPMASTGDVCPGGTFAWFRNGIQIAGATSSTYTPGIDDIGKNITHTVTCPDGSSTTSYPITVAEAREFRFPQPMSVDVYFTLSFKGSSTTFCNTPYAFSGSYNNTGSAIRGFSDVTRILPVSFITTPPSAGVIGYKSPTYKYTISCGNGYTWEDGNFGILGINGTTLVRTVYLGGGSGYSNYNTSEEGQWVLVIDDIKLTAAVSGIGPIGTSVWRLGLGWYADVTYLERFYGEVYIDGVLQPPVNPYGPPSTP